MTKFRPFLLHMLLGLPRLDVNLCNAIIKQSVLKSPANSNVTLLYLLESQNHKTMELQFYKPG